VARTRLVRGNGGNGGDGTAEHPNRANGGKGIGLGNHAGNGGNGGDGAHCLRACVPQKPFA
jgi:hypothetical protein